MEELKPSTCPNCGSPLDVKPGDTRIKCAYCGSSIMVSEHPDSTPEIPQFSFKIDDETYKAIGTAGKVVGGIAISSIVIPIIIAVVVLCGVGATLFFVFRNVNSTIKSVLELSTSTMMPLDTPYPTETPYPTPTVAPTETPLPTPTPFLTPVPFANVLFRDNFTSPSTGWSLENDADYVLEYKNGAYHVAVNARNGGQSVWIGSKYTNVSVEAEVNQAAGPLDALVGVSCRYQDGVGGYTFEFARNGTYGIYVYEQSYPNVLDEATLDPNTIDPNGPTHVQGICDGPTLTLVLNGVALMQVTDTTYTSGGAGVIVRTGDSGAAGIDVNFKQFVVKGP
jgi:LSD1 subclass zinc finger protein